MPRLASLTLALGLLAAGCGNSDTSRSDVVPAPAAADFPSADGRTTEEIFASQSPSEDYVVSPAGKVHRVGNDRFSFGVFTAGRDQINDAEVAIYVGPPDGPAKGPYPARVETLATDPAFAATTTSQDPDAAQSVYVSEVKLEREGESRVVALVRRGEELVSVRAPSMDVGRYPEIPAPGEPAIDVSTPTADDVANLDEIDTRDPHDTMHQDDLADVLGEKPVVLLFSTPLLCASRVCGPVVDVTEQVKAEFEGQDVAFIHQEIYEDNVVEKGLREQVAAYGLETEPWLFVIDRDGMVSTAIEGAFGIDELTAAVEKVAN